MSEKFRNTVAEINLHHFEHNLNWLMETFGKDRFISPMIKANAYGHGAIPLAKKIQDSGFESLGVCLIEEGLKLREAGIQTDILVYNFFDKYGAEKILDAELTPVIGQWNQIQLLESLADSQVDVHVKINTGLNRAGFNLDEMEKLFETFKMSKKMRLKGILSHLHTADNALDSKGSSSEQAKKLKLVLDYFAQFSPVGHLLNSPAIWALAQIKDNSESHYLKDYNWGMRPGIMIYGYGTESRNIFKPVMELKTTVERVGLVKKGESVSYGARWSAERDSYIATLPIGYADGLPRRATNKISVQILDKKVPVVGTICMDYIMVDVTEIVQSGQKIMGEEVRVFGDGDVTAQTWADASDTIAYEILTSVSDRVPRVYKG